MDSNGILVLGAAGFVGTSLINRLAKAGHKIYSVSTKAFSIKSFPGVTSYTSTLDDPKLLREILPRCDIVFYFASHSTPGFSAHKPSVEAESNLLDRKSVV